MKKWLVICLMVAAIVLLFSFLAVGPASAWWSNHRHQGWGIVIRPPVYFAPPPVYYGPNYWEPYRHPYPYSYEYYQPYQPRVWIPGYWEERWNSYYGYWERIWIPGYWRY